MVARGAVGRCVATPGRASGRMMRAKIASSLEPSTRAASTSSSGSVEKNARIRNIENGAEPLMYKISRPPWLFSRPRVLSSR